MVEAASNVARKATCHANARMEAIAEEVFLIKKCAIMLNHGLKLCLQLAMVSCLFGVDVEIEVEQNFDISSFQFSD